MRLSEIHNYQISKIEFIRNFRSYEKLILSEIFVIMKNCPYCTFKMIFCKHKIKNQSCPQSTDI